MIQKDFLSEIIRQQGETLQAKGEGMLRDKLAFLPDASNHFRGSKMWKKYTFASTIEKTTY